MWLKKYNIIERKHDALAFDFVIGKKLFLSDFEILGRAPNNKEKINVLSNIKLGNYDLKETLFVIYYYLSKYEILSGKKLIGKYFNPSFCIKKL